MKSGLKTFLPETALLTPAGIIFFTGFCVRLIYLYYCDARGGFDTLDYLKLADNLYNFGAYSLGDAQNLVPSIRRAPGYPYFLSFFQWLGGGSFSFQAVALVQCALDALTAAAIFLIARKIVAKPLAFAAALFYAFHPGAIFRSRLLLTECLFTFLLVAAVFVLIDAFEEEKTWLFMLAGFLFGLAVLTRPIAAVFPFVFILAARFRLKSGKAYLWSAIAGTFFLLTLMPWLIRCYNVSGQFVFVQGVTAFQYYAPTRVDLAQWDEKALWDDYFDPHTSDEYFRKLARAEAPAEFIEAEKIGRRKAIENIKAHPKEYVISRVKIYPYFVITSFDNFTGINKSYGTLYAEGGIFSLSMKVFLLLVFSLLPLVLSFVGLFRAGQNLPSLLCAFVWVSVLLIHLPMWIEYRFWIPFVPFQIISAAAGLAVLQKRFVSQKILKS